MDGTSDKVIKLAAIPVIEAKDLFHYRDAPARRGRC
jgi:hypothetical protein